ncbi:uncharacterized protein CMU_029830 [Cryptosporidium muris RN66]|uniref:SF-assemblin/beta giardin family protein n=1 Tax=Cryptosporidium muris (strain RN66) TaxID=441375 RepID=B6AI67_CRYMR|nr:uncharacterized protein CMU_029830 [Cryptosporidium muris RN66]EEA07908.1 hypothetical protein CMU_029830 [Cryptosporidium muris RN66]|eukprot:XP_002142257.1 hypothetical protein [Cryptosporidium muris RN66]
MGDITGARDKLIASSEVLNHHIKSLDQKIINIKREHISKINDLNSKTIELTKLYQRKCEGRNRIKEGIKKSVHELELQIAQNIANLRESRHDIKLNSENTIKNYLDRNEDQHLNFSSDVDIKREQQFNEMSNSLSELTNNVELLRQKRKGIKDNIQTTLENKIHTLQDILHEEKCKRENDIESIDQLMKKILSHFKTELANSKSSRIQNDYQILTQLEVACQKAEDYLSKIVNINDESI